MSTISDIERSTGSTKLDHGLVDCDVHEHLLSPEDLVPYLSYPWKEWVKHWAGIYDSQSYVHPLLSSRGRAVTQQAATGSRTGLVGVDYEVFRRDHLEKYNVQYAILTSFFYPSMMKAQPEFAVAVASAYNDWLIETWLARDERLRGSIQIASQEPEAAAREIDRVGDHPQLVQVTLPLTDVAYGSPCYHPIFAAAERHNLVIAFHQSLSTHTPVGPTMRYYIEWHTAYSLAFMTQVISLIFEGVFDKYPQTRVIMLEGGFTWLPHVMWRMDQNYKQLRVEVPWVKRMPSETIREHFRFGSQPMEDISAKQLMTIFDLVGSDNFLVFASDYPHWDSDEPAYALPVGLPTEITQKIMYKNALEFYRLKLRF